MKKCKYFAIGIVLICFSCNSNSEEIEEEHMQSPEPDPELACEICVLEDQRLAVDMEITMYKALGSNNDTMFDSLFAIRDELETELEEIKKSFNEQYAFSSDQETTDSSRAWCVNSKEFSPEKSGAERDSVMINLYTLLFKSSFDLDGSDTIPFIHSQLNEDGKHVIYEYENGQHFELYEDQWSEWTRKQVVLWNEWKDQVNNEVSSFCGKSYDELTLSEQFILGIQLSIKFYESTDRNFWEMYQPIL